MNQRAEKLLGFSKDDIANTIIQGFEEGKTATEIFAENFEDVLKTAVRKALMTSFLEGESMKAFYDMFYNAMQDGTLTDEERKTLKESYQSLIWSAQSAAEFFRQATGVDIFEQTPNGRGHEQAHRCRQGHHRGNRRDHRRAVLRHARKPALDKGIREKPGREPAAIA